MRRALGVTVSGNGFVGVSYGSYALADCPDLTYYCDYRSRQWKLGGRDKGGAMLARGMSRMQRQYYRSC